MKRKKPIPGVRLLLCALLAAAALVGVTQRAEAAYEQSESIEITAVKGYDSGGTCSGWFTWGYGANGTFKEFKVTGPGRNEGDNERGCEHSAMLQFKNITTLEGELTVKYKYNSYAPERSGAYIGFWLFPTKTGSDEYCTLVGEFNHVSPSGGYSFNGSGPGYGPANPSLETATIPLKANETACMFIKLSKGAIGAAQSSGHFDIYSVRFTPSNVPVNVTFQAPVDDGDSGSYDVSYDGTNYPMTNVSPEKTASITSGTQVTLTATPKLEANNYIFRDWYDATNNKTLSTNPTATLQFAESIAVTARYVDPESTPVFWAGNQTFTDLDEAAKFASQTGTKTVFLVKSGAINKSCTIPDGVTLLLPWMVANGVYSIVYHSYDNTQLSNHLQIVANRDSPISKGVPSSEDPKNTRGTYSSVKLTMNSGASITVKSGGAIEVGGMYVLRQGGKPDVCFAPAYRFGHIDMRNNTSITLENGGKLYAWGYITGNGTVTAESGAEVWELFQIADFSGGSAMEEFDARKGDWKIFPFSQYYIQNIEAELVLKAGAKEKIVSGVGVKTNQYPTATATLIGDNIEGLFRLQKKGENGAAADAEFRRKYDPKTDRIAYTITQGTVHLSKITVDFRAGSIQEEVDSSKYVLPINGNTTVNIESGAMLAVTNDTSLLPGVEVNIAAGGTLSVWDAAHLYIYDETEWKTGTYCYQKQYFQAVAFSPSVSGSKYPVSIRTKESLQDVKIDINGTLYGCSNVYTTAGGANICSSEYTGVFVAAKNTDPNFSDGILKQKVFGNDPTNIPFTLAKLKNGNDSYTQTTASKEESITYYYHTDTETWGTERVVYATLNYNYDGAKTETIPSTKPLPTPPARTGFEFTGWNTAKDGTGTTYEAGKTCSNFTSDTTLYAQWKPKTYTLTIADNGAPLTEAAKNLTLKKADGSTISQENGTSLKFKVVYGDEITLPKAAEFGSTYSGSTLSGWKTVWCDKPTAYPLGAKITISDELAYGNSKENIAIQAQWSREYYTVTASSALVTDGDIKNAALKQANPVADVSLDGLGKYTSLEDTVTVVAPEKNGYTFRGWYGRYMWGSDTAKYQFSPELKANISLHDLANNCGMLKDGMATTGHIQLFAVYTPETAAPLTLTLDKAPTGVTVNGNGVSQASTTNTWSVPVGTEVTINVPNGTNFRYWTNANDKVMSKETEYTFTMVTDTTLTAETSTSNTFVIFQSADERLLSVQSDLNALTLPAAPYRVGYEFKGWSIDGADPVPADKVSAALSGKNSVVTVTAAYEEITEAEYTVTATANVSGVTIEGSGSSYKLGEIAKFTAPEASSDGSAFRFWASNKDGTNILSFSTTYSFRVTQNIEIYVIYGGEAVTDRPPVVRVDSVLKNDSPQSLTFMIGASIPDGYTLVEMGALYTKDVDSGNDTTLRVENVNNSTVRKAVSRLKHEDKLTDYSYALGFNMTGKLTDTISLRGYVAVKKTDNNTIYYYYSGVHSASYQSLSGTSS